MPTIEVSSSLYERLVRGAAARQTTIDGVLDELADRIDPSVGSPHDLTPQAFRALLDQASVVLPGVPSLPADFSRADMYDDHD